MSAGIGYAVDKSKEGDADKIKARAQYAKNYNDYRIEMERINLEREKRGLKPAEIRSFEDWLNTLELDPEEKLAIMSSYKSSKEK